MKRVYLDYAATTPIRKEIIKQMANFWQKDFGNPSTIYLEGRIAKNALDKARNSISKILNSEPEEIIFTNGGTESINLAILGVAKYYKNLFAKPRIITSKIEHPAVLECFKNLEKQGFETIYLNVDEFGFVNLEELKASINNQTILISIIYANNEIGTIQPISEISKIIRNSEFVINKLNFPFLHIDACQATGFLNLNIKELGVDLMTINASKIYGPKASGILYKKSEIQLEPIILGGGQENNLRSGTENVASWIGLAKALELAQKEKSSESKRLTSLRNYFIKKLLEIPGSILNGPTANRLPNNINIIFKGIEGEAMILYLDKFGIGASTGSACHSKSLTPSHVLTAIGRDKNLIHGSLRLTLGKQTTKKQIKYAISKIKTVVEKLRKISAAN